MAEELPKGAPPVTPKQKSKETLERGQRANTGGDHYDRFRGQYAKNPPKSDSFDGDFGGSF